MIKKSSYGKIGGFDFSKKTTPKFRKVKPMEKDPTTGEYLNDSLNVIYIPDGEENIYDKIQSHKRECDIYEILRNCMAIASTEPLGNYKDAPYADITGVPQSIAETFEKAPTKEEIDELKKQYAELKDALNKAKEETKTEEQAVESNE